MGVWDWIFGPKRRQILGETQKIIRCPRMAISCQTVSPFFQHFSHCLLLLKIFSPHNTHTTRILFVFPLRFSVFFPTHTYTHAHTHLQSTCLSRGLSKSIRVNTRKTVKRENSDAGSGKVAKDQWNHLVAGSLQSFPHFLEEANDWRNRERVVLELFSNFKWARSCGNFG